MQHTTIKRSYFNREICERKDLGVGVEVMSGVYQSIRMAEGRQLVANVDVSRTVFWNVDTFENIVANLANHEGGLGTLVWRDGNQQTNSGFEMMKRLKGSWFTVQHKNQTAEAKKRQWEVAAIRSESARECKFRIWDSAGNAPGAETTIFDHYQHQYGITLDHPDLPVVQTTKNITKRDKDNNIIFESPVTFPLEFCSMRPNQRYPYKLDEEQTTKMIKFTVQGPRQRLDDIHKGLNMLGWQKDGFLNIWGLKICSEQIRTQARMLEPPKLLFKGLELDLKPGKSGKWHLTNKQFIASNTAPLISWGVMIIKSTTTGRPAIKKHEAIKKNEATKKNEAIKEHEVDHFVSELVVKYKNFGGDIKTENPQIRSHGCKDLATAIPQFYEDIKKEHNKMRPQILVFILPSTDAQVYFRIKQICDCQLGVYSQCVQAEKAQKSEYSYISNLLMKFNAKLGGKTNTTVSQPNKSLKPSGQNRHNLKPDVKNVQPTSSLGSTTSRQLAARTPRAMYIGADVSHPAPGGHAPSYAAMTVSMDKTATRYSAAVQTNGFRQEMISTPNLRYCLTRLLEKWIKDVGEGLPDHVYYFRDGVGESQYKTLLAKEVADIRQIFRELNETHEELKTKFIVVVAEKRHHIRFLPEGGKESDKADGNGNPLPGTIVDRDVTDWRGNDIYLCSHTALKGTARPTHYTMLLDEANIDVDTFQRTLYEQCYQYVRSTTAVSLHPAVYYAHLASKRAQAHDNGPRNDPPPPKDKGKGKGKGSATSSLNDSSEEPAPPKDKGKGKGKGPATSSSDDPSEEPAALKDKAKGKGKDPATSSSDDSSEEPALLLPLKDWKDGQTEWIGYGMWFI